MAFYENYVKLCYYVLARNRIALTQDFLSWVWGFVAFVNFAAIVALAPRIVKRKCCVC